MPPLSSLAPAPPPKGERPATAEGVSSFRVHTAALSRPAAPERADAAMVLVTDERGCVIVYPASDKLAILAGERAKRMRDTSANN
jgi:hypothetical protein